MLAAHHDHRTHQDEPGYGITFALHAHNLLKGRGLVIHDEQNRSATAYEHLQGSARGRLLEFDEIPVLEPSRGFYPDDYEAPGYMLWIAAVWKLFGVEQFYPVRLLQAVLSSLMVWPIFQVGRRLFGERVGLAAAFLWAVFLPEARLAVMTLRESWLTWAGILAFWAVARSSAGPALSRRWVAWAALAGAFGALAAWMRGSAIVYLPFVLAGAAVWMGAKSATKVGAVAMAVSLLGVFPIAKRNHDLFGRWELRGWFHYALLSGLCEGDPSLYRFDVLGGKGTWDGPPLPDDSRLACSPEDPELKRNVMSVYRERPLWVARLAAKRTLRCLFSSYQWGVNDDAYLASRSQPLRARALAYARHPFLALKWLLEKLFLPAGVACLIAFPAARRANAMLLAAFLCYPIFHGLTIYQARFLIPGTWPVCLFGAQLALAAAALLRARRGAGAA
jgi:hypothetical protein